MVVVVVVVVVVFFLIELKFYGFCLSAAITGREIHNCAAIINDPLGCLELSIRSPFQILYL